MSEPRIKVEVVIDESTRQILKESIVTLAQEAIKIRQIDAEVTELSSEIIRDKVIIQGTIHKQIFFVGLDNIVHHQSEDLHFSTFVDIEGARPGMNAQVRAEIQHIAFHLLAPDLLKQKVIIDVFVKVTETQNLFVNVGEGPLVRAEEVVAKETGQMLEEETIDLDLPAIKVTDIVVSAEDLSFEAITDKVIIQGTLHKQIFYIGEDNLEHHQGVDAQFSHFVDALGTRNYHNVQIDATIAHVEFELDIPEGATAGTQVEIKTVVDFFVEVTNPRQFTLTLNPAGPLLKVDVVRGENTSQLMQESDIELEREASKIKEIIARLEDLDTTVIQGKVIIQGLIEKQIFYVSDDLEYHEAEEIPFTHMVEVPNAQPGLVADVVPTIEHISFNLETPTLLHQKVVVDFLVKVTQEQQLNVEVVTPYP